MAATKTEVNHFIRRSYGRRALDLGKYVLTLPGQAIDGFRRWPRRLRYLFTGMGLLAGLGAAVIGARFYLHRSEEIAVRNEWIAIKNEFSTTADTQKIKDSLDRILALRPDDPQAKSHKIALDSLHGDPADAALTLLIFRELQRAGRTDDLKRECERRLEYEPRDYYAHFLLTNIYLGHNDAVNAEPHLAALAMPDVNNVNLNFNAIAGAMQILSRYQRDTTRMRQFTSERIVPMMKSDRTANSEPEVQFLMLYLFTDTFRLPKIPQDAGLAWPAASRVADLCLEGAREKGDFQTVGRLAALGPLLIDALVRMRNVNQITEPQRVELAKECEERTRKAWNFVLEKQPKSAEAFYGLIQSQARSGEGREAIETLTRGLEACGDDPLLLQVFTNLAMANYHEMAGYERLKLAAERNPNFPKYWYFAAQAAYKADRRDLALLALAKARTAIPNDLDVAVLQAEIYTGTGRPEMVLMSLAGLPSVSDNLIVSISPPKACELFARALGEIGDDERLENCLDRALELSRKADNPLPAYFAALGLYKAEPLNPARAAKVAEYLVPVTERWRVVSPATMVLRAAALVRACELKPGPLDPVAARDAITACEFAVAVEPNDVATWSNLLRLRIRGDRDPIRALNEIDPLLAKIDQLKPDEVETLAMVYNANKKFDDAVRVVTPYTKGRTSAGCWVQLAVAYCGQSRPKDANEALDSALNLPMSDRERADYTAARDLLTRVKP